jgi:hypothetical protein
LNSNVISGLSALAGAGIGGLASLGGSWLTQWLQIRDKNLELERTRREALYSAFIEEASRLYGDALSHEKDDVADLVHLYALLARMRLMSSAAIIAKAETTLQMIIETYLAPNRSLQDLKGLAAEGGMNFLQEFGEACRDDLRAIGGAKR